MQTTFITKLKIPVKKKTRKKQYLNGIYIF